MLTEDNNLVALMGIQTKSNVSDQLYQRISSLILSGDLKEGYVFPNETVLCEQLQVGRTSLREAYKALELTGYVTRTKRGTSVNSRDTIFSSTPLKRVFQMADTKDFGQYRLMLEAECAYLAASNANLKDIERLEALIDASRAARKEQDYLKLISLDTRFHCEIAKMSQNSLILSTVSVITETWEANIQRNFAAAIEKRPDILDHMIDEHILVVTNIRGRDCKNARKAMREHILHISDDILI